MNKHQKKYSNTAIKMNQALISLMEKQTFDSITIKALCEKAGINRSTFYSHYQNL
ncbi:MAG: TetR/AcrR family transcriptional regulator, partial [Firmicutes bacterium]|nr:TetR/AcrR family transcriptional regulator [Bacillota bacterium]